jgi:hypothetical protein
VRILPKIPYLSDSLPGGGLAKPCFWAEKAGTGFAGGCNWLSDLEKLQEKNTLELQ